MGLWIVVALFVVLNLYGFAIMGYDKKQAQQHKRRVPEKRLFAIAFWGGGIGAWWGMQHFRHKTQHTTFRILFPIALVWCLVVYFFLFKWVA